MFDLLIRNAVIADPLSGFLGKSDIAVEDGLIAEVARTLPAESARETLEGEGLILQPGIVDARLALSLKRFDPHAAVKSVTTTLIAGASSTGCLLKGLAEKSCGLTVAILKTMLPGENISGPNPTAGEIEAFMETALEEGAFGIKLLGAHFSLTPEATGRCLEASQKLGAWISVQAGKTQSSGTPFERLEEVVSLAHGIPFLLTHLDDFSDDPGRTAALLEAHPEIITEICFEEPDESLLPHALAGKKRSDGSFLIDFMSSQDLPADGASVLDYGQTWMERGILTPVEFARRTALLPARALGFAAKGFISPGADADIVLYDPKTGKAVHSFACGRPILQNGIVVGKGGIVLTTAAGEDAVERHDLCAHAIPGGVPKLSRTLSGPTLGFNPTLPLIFPETPRAGRRI